MDSKVLFLFALIPIIVSAAYKHERGYGRKKHCPHGFINLGYLPNCYRFSTERTTWHVARQRCHEMGGFLAIIKDKRENDAITRYLIKTLPPKRQNGDNDYWIALQDIATEGFYKWDTTNKLVTSPADRSVRFQFWEDDEPNQSGPSTSKPEDADCVRINNDDSETDDVWKWADWDCNETFFYLCEARPGNPFRCNTH